MKTQIEIVQHLIDTLIEYIDKMVKRQQQLRKELTQNPTNTEFIVKKTEMDILQLQTEKLTELLKSTMTELMSLGNSNSDSCECETGKAVDRHHPNCKWMNDIFGDDINIL
jgi:hypothetical protein